MQSTNGTLLLLNEQRKDLPKQNLLLFLLLGSKLREFAKNNDERLRALIDKVNILQKKYYVFDGENIKFVGEEGSKEPVMIEGMLREDYDKEEKLLMDQEVTITV